MFCWFGVAEKSRIMFGFLIFFLLEQTLKRYQTASPPLHQIEILKDLRYAFVFKKVQIPQMKNLNQK